MTFKIGYLSRIAPEKGLDVLIDAFHILRKSHDNITLHIAGQMYVKDFWKKMQKRIQKYKLQESVVYHGELDLQQKCEFLQQCNVFSVPSRFHESRGLAVLEAIATGVPVVVPHMGVYQQILEDTEHGVLVSSHEPEEFAKALEQVICNENSQRKFRGESRSIFHEKYALTRMVEEVVSLYESVQQKTSS